LKLKDKLGRLDSGLPRGGALGLHEPVQSGPVLEELRRKMAELLEKAPPAPRRLVDPSVSELGFVRKDTEEGPLFAKLEALRLSHHVGRMPVSAAHQSSAAMLGLLSLAPELKSADFRRALYLDTETTGLGGGAGVVAFLVGLAWFDDGGGLVVEQLLLRQPSEELPLLRWVVERMERASVLVTFNGKTFDLPVLATRAVMNRLPPLPERPHLDLLHVGRRLHRARLGACRLTTLESEILGFVRGEDIDGAEVPGRYTHYLRTGDQECLRLVVEHNGWDLVSMAALVGLYGEPLTALHQHDLVALARTLKRAGALDEALLAAETALGAGAGPAALRARGEIAKARGDRAQALADFAALTQEVDDPSLRLELAKLYEHYVKEPLKALALVLEGTGEEPAAEARRMARLRRKVGQG
jgi:uncharacterized protein YprB with RNaseH-like and TPR domain